MMILVLLCHITVILAQGKVMTSLSRLVGAPSRLGPQCVLHKDILIELSNSIRSSIPDSQKENCLFRQENKNSCEEIVQVLQCGVRHLTNGFNSSTTNDTLTGKPDGDFESSFLDYIKEYQNVTGNGDQNVPIIYKENDKVPMTNLQSSSETTRTCEYNLKIRTRDLCVSDIGNGKIARAITNCRELGNSGNDLSEVIRSAYSSYGNTDNLENVLQFVTELRSLSASTTGYNTLFSEILTHEHFFDSRILLFGQSVQKSIDLFSSGPSACNCTIEKSASVGDLEKLNTRLTTYVNYILESWASKVHNNDFEEIKTFYKTHGASFESYEGALVDKAYGNKLGNVEIVLKFIGELPSARFRANALTQLHKRMKDNDQLDSYQLFMLAYLVKDTVGRSDYRDLSEDLKARLTTLTDGLPGAVRKIVWNKDSRCTFVNRQHKEYLYPANADHNYDRERGRVFTWVPAGGVFSEAYFRLESVDGGKSFTMWNTHWKSYMFASSDFRDKARREVFIWLPGTAVVDGGSWILSPVNNGKYFTVKSSLHKEFLYADSDMKYAFNADRRGVFTWRYCGDLTRYEMEYEGHWIVDCE